MALRCRVSVCAGRTCADLFADDVFRALRREASRKGLGGEVQIERGGCLDRCGVGVTVAVRAGEPGAEPGETTVIYPAVREADVPRLVSQHLLRGCPVVELQEGPRGPSAPTDGP